MTRLVYFQINYHVLYVEFTLWVSMYHEQLAKFACYYLWLLNHSLVVSNQLTICLSSECLIDSQWCDHRMEVKSINRWIVIMRNNTNIYSSNGLNVSMNINSIDVDSHTIPAINAHIHRNDCQPMGLPVATKSQPKPKSKGFESTSRPTKRPPSERRFKCDQCERQTYLLFCLSFDSCLISLLFA